MGVAFVYYGMAFRVGHCERYPSITLHVARCIFSELYSY
jgi:hypothetical protein